MLQEPLTAAAAETAGADAGGLVAGGEVAFGHALHLAIVHVLREAGRARARVQRNVLQSLAASSRILSCIHREPCSALQCIWCAIDRNIGAGLRQNVWSTTEKYWHVTRSFLADRAEL